MKSPKRKISISLFEFILFLLIFTGPPTFRRRDPTASLSGEIDFAIIIQVSVWIIALVWVILNTLGKVNPFSKMGTPIKLGIILAVIFGFSAVFSPAPPLTLFRTLQIIIAISFSLLLVKKYGWRPVVKFAFVGLTIILLILYGAFFVDPTLVMPDLDSIRIRGDVIAPAASVALCVLMVSLINPLRMSFVSWTTLALLASVMLILARTRMGFVTLAILVVLSFLTVGKRWSPFKIFFTAGIFLVLTAPLTIGWDTIETWIVRDYSQIETLNARTLLWTHLIVQTISNNLFLGLGYVAACRVIGPQAVEGLGNAHSSFIEVFVGGGLIALFVYLSIWFWVFLKLLIRFFKLDEFDFTFISILIIIFLTSLTTSHSILLSVLSFTFWMMLAAWDSKMALRRRQFNKIYNLIKPA